MATMNDNKTDENLVFYLFKYSILLEQNGRLDESIKVHQESMAMVFPNGIPTTD